MPLFYLPAVLLTNFGQAFTNHRRWRFLTILWIVLWLVPLLALPYLRLSGVSLLLFIPYACLATLFLWELAYMVWMVVVIVIMVALLPLGIAIALPLLGIAVASALLIRVSWGCLLVLTAVHNALLSALADLQKYGERIRRQLIQSLYVDPEARHIADVRPASADDAESLPP